MIRNLILTLSVLTIFSVTAPAAPPAVVEQQPKHETTLNERHYTKIFLAGTIDMGKSIDWQAATIERFRQLDKGRYLFYNPRRGSGLDGTKEDMYYQIRWELEHLERADRIIMNILGSSKSPISLLEMGIYIRSGKLAVACEPDYYRYDNVKITCERYGVRLYPSLDALLEGEYNIGMK